MALLDSRIVVITGGSLGIGLESAKKAAGEGATVVVAARNRDDLEKAVAELERISTRGHQSYVLDVSRYRQVQKFARWCSDRFPAVHGLVNCAGVYGPIGKTHKVSIKAFTEAININFLGTVHMCHAFVPLLRLAPVARKKIVNYSGGGGATPFPHYSAYATSKAATVRFTENLALELTDENFDVNCIAPGFVVTRLHQQTAEAGPEQATRSFFESTLKHLESGGVPPEKAAALTAFLLSPASDGITGKFVSAPWDPWEEKEFQALLRTDSDFATLRRIDNKTFFKK
ncbi:MAG: SDR family oxidoreductase [Deltaproteobacteria bacterium]